MTLRPVATTPRPYRFPDFVRHELSNGVGVWLVPLPDRELGLAASVTSSMERRATASRVSGLAASATSSWGA
jgi:hypothetical protein